MLTILTYIRIIFDSYNFFFVQFRIKIIVWRALVLVKHFLVDFELDVK